MTIDQDSWGYRRNAPLSSYLSIEDLITTLAETVSCGGNLLMNVGPTRDGIIAPIFEERLRQFGSWLAINGEAIYASKPWSHQNDTVTKDLWYTSQITADGETVVYAIVLKWPKNDALFLGAPVTNKSTKVHLLGYSGSELSWTAGSSGGLTVTFPSTTTTWAWVLKLENVSGSPTKNDNKLLFKKKKVVRVFYNDVV
jgi:alpha-L-fucosidase